MKPHLIFTIIIFSFFGTGCYDKAGELPYNILDDESAPAFIFEGHTAIIDAVGAYDIEVRFSSVYDELPDGQKNRIKGIRIYRNGGAKPLLPVDATTYSDRSFSTICYELAFMTTENDLSQRSEKYCVEP